jgi:hypothetical protein
VRDREEEERGIDSKERKEASSPEGEVIPSSSLLSDSFELQTIGDRRARVTGSTSQRRHKRKRIV